MDTQTQIDRLIELAIIQRSELKQLVEQLPQLRDHLNAEVEKVFDETEPQLRAELEEWTTKQTADKTAALGVALEAKIADLAKSLEVSTQARYNAIIAEREENARLAAQAEAKIAEHAASLPGAVKEIVSAELARFPRAGEIDQLRKEFAEPRGLNPRGKWQAGETYNKLDLVTINGDSYTSNTDGNRTRPSRSSADWTLVAARGTGGGGGPTSLSELTTVPSDGDLLIGSGTSWVTSNLTAGAGISITVGPGAITISATDGDITLDDGTADSPSLHFTNDADTGIYRPAANTLGISVSGTQVAYFDENGLTVPSAGVVAGGSIHAGNGNANNPSLSFDGDQDTGFYRHQANGIGMALGGTQYADFHSSGFSITPSVTIVGALTANGTSIPASKTLVVTTDKISALAATTSAELAGKITDETGTGALVFANTPTLVTPNIGAATGTSVNLSGAGTFGGNLTVSGGTGTIDATSGTASATLNLVGRSSGTAKTASVLANSAGSLVLGAEGAGSSLTIAANTGNTTVAYNLTVSGTGTSSVAGNVNVAASASGTAILGLGVTPNTWYSSSAFAAVQMRGISLFGNTGGAGGILAGNQYLDSSGTWRFVANGAGSWYSFQSGIHQWYTAAAGLAGGAATNTELMRLATNGNFLLGTTTDGGQKLQVSGDIISTSTSGSNIIANDPTFNHPVVQLREAGTNKAAFETVSGDAYVSTQTAGKSLYLRSGNGTTALTLSGSDQSATFAGWASIRGTGSGSAQWIGDDGASGWFLNVPSGNTITFGVNNVSKLSVDGNTTIFGTALRLNNAYQAGAPTATGYVTIQDSAGNTYKVLVGT